MGRVEVKFQVDADGILSVTAKEQTSGVTQHVSVKPTHGLTDEEIEEMLLASIDHAEDDMERRLLTEQKVEAARMVLDAEKQLRENGDLLSDDERRAFSTQLTELKQLSDTATDHSTLKAALTALDEHSRPFVERIMNRAISKAVAGHSVEEY